MRILYLHQYFTTPSMPGGTRSFEMARRFVQQGHEVHVVTSRREPHQGGAGRAGRWSETLESGIHVHWIDVPYSSHMSYRQRLVAFFRYAILAGRKAATIPADVLFATSTPLTIALPAVHATRRHRIPLVFEVRDLWPAVPIALGVVKGRLPIALARWLERFAYRHADRVVALSPGIRDGVLATGYPPERIHVIPNAADLALFQVPATEGARFRAGQRWLNDRPLILYTGAMGYVNGVHYLVQIARAMQDLAPEVRFLVIGDGREEERVRKLARELGVLDRNLFLQAPLPKTDIPAVLSAASLAVSLTIPVEALWHNSANKFFDALAAGRPVAINYGGWQADLLQATGAGLVLPPDDAPTAACLLAAHVRDPDWLRAAGAAAAKLARDQFDRDQLAASLLCVLAEAAKRR